MSDLISRTALREAVEKLEGRCHDGEGLGCETYPCVENVGRDDTLALIDAAPAAEPVPLTLDARLRAIAQEWTGYNGDSLVAELIDALNAQGNEWLIPSAALSQPPAPDPSHD